MKFLWSNKYWVLVCLVLILALGFTSFRYYQLQKDYINYQSSKKHKIKYYQDKEGRVHATKVVTQIPKGLYKHITDSIVAEVSKNTMAKDLVQHTDVTTKTSNRDTVLLRDTFLVRVTDTLQARVFHFDDNALVLTGLLMSNQVDLSYSYQVHLSHTTKWQRTGLFKPKQLIVDVYSNTPNTTITGLQTFVIKQPPKRWYETKTFQIGLSFIAGYAAGKTK